MNRTKTRKWVEAKVQSYDGDDWGADEYDEDDDEPEPAPPVPPAKHDAPPPPTTHPEHHASPAPFAVPSATGGLPSLQTLHTPATGPSTQQSRPAGVTSPVVSDPSSLGSPVDRDRVVSPQSTVAGASIASNTQPSEAAADKTSVGQPSDTSRFVGEAKESGPKPADELRLAEAKASDRHDTVDEGGESQVKNGVGAGFDESDRRRFSVSPKLPAVARMSAFGTDLFSPGGSGFIAEPTVTEKDSDVSSLASPTCFAQYDVESTKPKAAAPVSPPVVEETPIILTEPVQAPADHQPGDIVEASAGDKSTIADVDRPSSVKSAAGDTRKADVDESPAALPVPQVATESTDGPGISPVSEPGVGPHSIIGSSISEPPELRPEGGLSTIPPLRTPSPRAPTDSPTEQARQEPSEAVQPITVGNAQPDLELDGSPLLRQSTLSTVNESPMKDNDALSEEILRSLSPTRSGPADAVLGGDASKLQPGERNVARESSYTLKDYDSYWADTSKPEPIPEREPPTETEQPVPDAKISPTGPPEAAKAEVQATSPREPGLRRKFSWEADETEQAKSPALAPAPATAPEVVRSPAAATVAAAGDISTAEVSQMQERDASSVAAVAAQQHQEPEPPSPVSTSDEQARLSKRLSLADEKAVSQLAPTPPPEPHPATAGPSTANDVMAVQEASTRPQQQTQVMTFREIMGLSSSTDRINKYNETREYFAANDSGLDTWLVTLKDQHPEYANGAVPYGATAGRQSAPGSSSASPVGTQPPSQQPYYQQYLNASSPTAAGPSPTSRSRLGGLQMPSQGSGSAFGHSGNQIGTKSKEFMHSAGKMGKGLLSKGKSKLRASGDKVFH